VSMPPFRGRDVCNIGFRYRSARNTGRAKVDGKGVAWNRFYLALSYIKVYRSQPEPEFVYLSDARIPPVVVDSMVRHDARQLIGSDSSSSTGSGGAMGGIRLLDDAVTWRGGGGPNKLVGSGQSSRSPEETYFKYCGEEILKSSGLSYAIVRVSDFNDSPSSSAETIDLSGRYDEHDTDGTEPVSRADVAKVCVSALLDPAALNKSFYVRKRKVSSSSSSRVDEDMSSKFAALPMDQIA
jgi:NAD(P)H-binding